MGFDVKSMRGWIENEMMNLALVAGPDTSHTMIRQHCNVFV
jgi:hypothetical protein